MQTRQPANSRISMSEFLYSEESIILCSPLFVLKWDVALLSYRW